MTDYRFGSRVKTRRMYEDALTVTQWRWVAVGILLTSWALIAYAIAR